MQSKIKNFLNNNVLATVCLVDENGKPHGASVYYYIENEKLRFICAKDTYKYKILEKNSSACLVICDKNSLKQVVIKCELNLVKTSISGDLSKLMNKLEYQDYDTSYIPLFKIDGSKVVFEVDLNNYEIEYEDYGLAVQNL